MRKHKKRRRRGSKGERRIARSLELRELGMATMVLPASAPHVASLRSSNSHGRRQQDGSRTAASVALLSAATTSNCTSLASSLQETRGISSSSSSSSSSKPRFLSSLILHPILLLSPPLDVFLLLCKKFLLAPLPPSHSV